MRSALLSFALAVTCAAPVLAQEAKVRTAVQKFATEVAG